MSEIKQNNDFPSENKNSAFITLSDGLDEKKKKNLHITVGLLAFTWMVFHFAVVFFFTFRLESITMVGIFLGIGNFFAFLFDVPLGILQNHIKAKTMYMLGAISQTIALIIFGLFIFKFTDLLLTDSKDLKIIDFFLDQGINFVLMLVACICYGFTKEANEITTISYVLGNSNPAQYKNIIAGNNLSGGIGSFFGLITSGFILTFAPGFILLSIIVIIGSIFYFANSIFDNSEYSPEISDLTKFKVYFDKDGVGKIKNNIVETVNKIDLRETIGKTKYIFLKPPKFKENMISVKELIIATKESFIDIIGTMDFAKKGKLIVYWSVSMFLTFGFWDTFASTFLIDFLDKVKEGWSFLLLGLIAIPAFGLQDFFGKLADKMGTYFIANIGLLLSGGSLFVMGFFGSGDTINSPTIVIFLALINSIGYAICMSLSAGIFLEEYNKTFAEYKGLKEIDSNASAAPMKILQNLANVFGLALGGLILGILGYSGFFYLFGAFMLGFMGWSLKNKKEISK